MNTPLDRIVNASSADKARAFEWLRACALVADIHALDAAILLHELARLNEAARWIPVGERLPTHIHSVDIWIVGGPPHLGESFRDIGIYNARRGKWQVNFGDDDVDVEVSHWREPPEDPAVT
jgi:hypothetical protein